MKGMVFLALFIGPLVCGATNFPSHIGMGSKASTVGKLSSYSSVSGGLWTGYWRPTNLTVGIKEEPAIVEQPTKVWPNPSNGVFAIEYTGSIKVFSQVGTIVFEGDINGSLDLTTAPAGMYVARTEDGRTIKIIKQ